MSGLASLFPPPPPYYKQFTAENVREVTAFKERGEDNAEIPEHLRLLFPPEKPDTSKYRGFGSIWNTQETLVPLEEVGVSQLYSQVGDNREGLQAELKKLLRSALVNYVTLVGVMSINPEEFPSKVEDLRVILINMHHLLNIYRPHETRENLVLLMTKQVSRLKEENERMRAANANIENKLNAILSKLPQPTAISKDDHVSARVWQGFQLSIDGSRDNGPGLLDAVPEEDQGEMMDLA